MTDSKRIVEEYMDAVFHNDVGRIRHVLHEDYSYTGSDGHSERGIDAGVAIAEMYYRAFPDMKYDIKNMFLSGNMVITEFIVRGTHTGNLMDISPTNRKIEIPVCNVTEIREGKIFAEREYYDKAFMMQQLGVEIGHAHA